MKKAFTLMELLIVILIVGVVYTLSIGSFKKIGTETKKLSLKNLKEYLQEFEHEKSVEILCLDDCSSCDIFVDGEKVTEKGIEGFLDDSVKVHRYNYYTGVEEKSKRVYFNNEGIDEDICFSYSVDRKGIGEQMIVEFKEKVYDFSVYLTPIPVYDSIADLVDEKESLVQEILR